MTPLSQQLEDKKKEYKELYNSNHKNFPNSNVCRTCAKMNRCQAEIQALKKGIEACEEIQSTHKKILIKIASKFGVRETLLAFGNFKDVEIDEEILNSQQKTTKLGESVLANQNEYSFELSSPKSYDECSADTQTLIKQAVEQRDKEILEIIDKDLFNFHDRLNNPELPEISQANLSGMIIALSSIKQQLTNSEGKE